MSTTRHIYVSTIVASAAGFGAGLVFEKITHSARQILGIPIELDTNNANITSKLHPGNEIYKSAIHKSSQYVKRFKEQTGCPGVVIGVSVNGNVIWEEGHGLANVETVTPCQPDTAMRIASISKPITMALAAKLWEAGSIDLDQPIQKYVSTFPSKKVESEQVTVTLRQLASHTAGVRHYTKKGDASAKEGDDEKPEFYLKNRFNSIEESVNLFKDDELMFKPGTSFLYTTHGYTLISAAIEGAVKKPFTKQIEEVFQVFGMSNTHLDNINQLIANRASYYTKDKKGGLINAELADTSYKWAGGGFVSTVGDLLHFANAMLYCYQQDKTHKPGYLSKETIDTLWTPVKGTHMRWGQNSGYGLGWTVVPFQDSVGGVPDQQLAVGHGGGAVGASSVLIILPKPATTTKDINNNAISQHKLPRGVAVAILVNLQDVSCYKLAMQVATTFQEVDSKQ